MLIGIVKEKNDTYYIYQEENTKVVCIINIYKNNIRSLNERESIEFLNNLLVSDLTFKEKNYDYDIYIDEAYNKRYFKDGKEDLKLFFNNNGKYAIYYDKNNEDEVEDEIKAKKFVIRHGKKILLVTGILSLYLTLELIPKLKYRLFEPLYLGEDMTLGYAKELINESEYISESDKSFIYNDALLEEVLRISDQNRDYELKTKLKDIQVSYYHLNDKVEGVYYDFNPNVIYLDPDFYQKTSDKRNKVLCHEFIHLLQTNNNYDYINEACAEIISCEYYDMTESSYIDRIKLIKILMEIIGPEPILNCNFSSDTTLFEESINKYLDNDDANKLLNLFTNDAFVHVNEKEKEKLINKEIFQLLSKMYYNKNNKNIKDDNWMMYLYDNGDRYNNYRMYFNKKNDLYYKDIDTKVALKEDGMTFEELIKSNMVDKYCYDIKEDITKSEYHYLLNNALENAKPFKNVSWDEELNCLKYDYVKYITVERKNIKEDELYDNCMIEIYTKDGLKYRLRYFKDYSNMEPSYIINYVKINEPSIYEKFEGKKESEVKLI